MNFSATSSPLTQLVPNIFEIIITYIHPYELTKIFASHNLNFNMIFTYDVSKYVLDIFPFHLIFGLFPNIILKGLNIIYNPQYNFPSVLPQKMSVIKISYTTFDLTTLQKYTNLTKLHLQCVTVMSSTSTISFKNLSTLTLELCDFSNCSFLQRFPNLRTIKIFGNIKNNLLTNLTNCNTLQTITCGTIYFEQNAPFNIILSSITHIKISNILSLNKHSFGLFMQTMPNLKRITITAHHDSILILSQIIIPNTHNLTHITFVHHPGKCPITSSTIIIPSALHTLETLKTITFINCTTDTSILNPSTRLLFKQKN